MKRILVRSGKSPYDILSAEASLASNGWGAFGANSGNLLFQMATFKTLSIPNTEVISDSLFLELGKINDEQIERINAEFDMFVIPLANAFRESFVKSLNNLTKIIKRLTIPVVVIGVGAQVKNNKDFSTIPDQVNEATREFVSAVLDRSSSIGVRGEITKGYLKNLGFSDSSIDIIGCPSLYMYGSNLQVKNNNTELNSQSQIAMNVTPSATKSATLIAEATNNYPNLTYIPQEHTDLAMMIWGDERGQPKDIQIPIHLQHPLYLQNRMRFFVDAIPWIDYLRQQQFSFGTRIHGNIAAILAQTPALVITHDSRTLELVNHHAIPHRTIDSIDASTTIKELYTAADYTEFNKRHPKAFEEYLNFLKRNDIENIFESKYDNEQNKFDNFLTSLKFPPAVEVSRYSDNVIDDIYSKLRWLRQGMQADKNRKFAGAYIPDFLSFK
ncbi:polysaccharide pyruvyl transferase family protein [Acinetobacter sp.]|uniref:polysaccharide pyruvyl transferase family protein n=1 Tax=Acinetobacter sp. TaxID=472 RepID=UPI002FD94F61